MVKSTPGREANRKQRLVGPKPWVRRGTFIIDPNIQAEERFGFWKEINNHAQTMSNSRSASIITTARANAFQDGTRFIAILLTFEHLTLSEWQLLRPSLSVSTPALGQMIWPRPWGLTAASRE